MSFKYISNKKTVIKKIEKIQDLGLEKIGILVKEKAVSLVPVLSGDLRNSIDYYINKETGEVDVGVLKGSKGADYAIFVERGTKYQKAQPYMRPACVNSEEDTQKIIKELIKKELI